MPGGNKHHEIPTYSWLPRTTTLHQRIYRSTNPNSPMPSLARHIHIPQVNFQHSLAIGDPGPRASFAVPIAKSSKSHSSFLVAASHWRVPGNLARRCYAPLLVPAEHGCLFISRSPWLSPFSSSSTSLALFAPSASTAPIIPNYLTSSHVRSDKPNLLSIPVATIPFCLSTAFQQPLVSVPG